MLTRFADEGRAIFFVAEGRVGIVLKHEGYPDFTALELGPGECFGVSCFLDTDVLTASTQAVQFSVVHEIALSDLEELFETHPSVRQRLEKLAADREDEYVRRRKAHAVDFDRRAQLAKKAEIMSGLTGRVGDFFTRGGIFALFGRSTAVSREAVVEAAMAATALVAIADGIVEDEEREHVIHTFDELDLLRHVDTDKAMERFDKFAQDVKDDYDTGLEEALTAIRPLADDLNSAELILGICVAVSAADGEVEEPEEEMIERIRIALDLPAEEEEENAKGVT